MRGKWLMRTLKKKAARDNFEVKRFFDCKRLKSTDFSIISNNCWAGSVYRYYRLPYLSPTVGLYFFAQDYIKFIYNLKHYLTVTPQFIDCEDSAHRDILYEKKQNDKPLARIDDIEVVFLHYATAKEAEEKWKRRAERVNFDNMIIKFSQMNQCELKQLEEFDLLPFEKKLVFVANKELCGEKIKSAVYYPGYESAGQVLNDTEIFPRAVNISKLVNSAPCKYLI